MLLVVLSFSIIYSGCASAPTEEINATKAALEGIQSDDVRDYAPESLKAAEDEMNRALAEVQVQDGKFALGRNYKDASAILVSVKDLVEKASTDAQANKAKAKADAEAAVAELPSVIEEARTILAKAPKGKDTKADIEAMQNDLKIAEEALNEATVAITAELYKDALAKAASSKQKADSIIEQVKQAQEKIGGRR